MNPRKHDRQTGATLEIAALGFLALGLLISCADRNDTTRSEPIETAPPRGSSPPAIGELGNPSGSPDQSSILHSTITPPTPEEALAAYREGVELYDSRDFAGASSRLEIAASGRPDHSYTHYLHGLALWKSGRADEAGPALERASAIDGTSIKTWINLARVRMELRDGAGALEAAGAALAIDPASVDALHQKGRALAALDRSEEAIETLSLAREGDPGNGYVANTLGWVLIQRGEEALAIPHLESARDRLPEVAYVRNNLGVAYERTGRLADAREEYRVAVDRGDSEGRAAASLARVSPLLPDHAIVAEDRGALPEQAPGSDVDPSADPMPDSTVNELRR